MIKNLYVNALNGLRQFDMTFKLLLIYIITIPIMKTPNLPLLAQRIQFSEIIFLFLFICWLKVLMKNKRLLQDAGLNKPFLLFIFFCLLSFFDSTDLFRSALEVIGLIYLYIVLILVVNIVNDKQKLDTIIKVWICTLTVVLALGIIGWIICIVLGKGNPFCNAYRYETFSYHEKFPFLKNIYRILSTFRHSAGLANYLTVSLGFVISDLLLTGNIKYKTFLKIIIFFICLVMLGTISRNILGFMLAAFLIYNHFYKTKNLKFKISRLISILVIISAFLYINLFLSIFHINSFKIEKSPSLTHNELAINTNYAYELRLGYKIAALEMVKRHPFLGIGLGMYPTYVKKLNGEDYFKKLLPLYHPIPHTIYFLSLPIADPHNDILGYFAETGIFGGFAFVFFIGIFLYLICINFKNKAADQYFTARLFCFFASFIGVLIDSIDADVFKGRHVWVLMAMSLALITMHKNKVSKIA